MRHETYMRHMEDENEQAGKMAYGGVDMVNSPPHYNAAGTECIDAIQAATLDRFEYYLQGNIMKYRCRYRYKNGDEALKTSQW